MITGPNGTGKTSVLEALAYLGTRRSFRGAPREAMVRTGASERHRPGRARREPAARPWSRPRSSRPAASRTQVNRKSVTARQRPGRRPLPCTVFSPEDLAHRQRRARRAGATCSTTRWPCSTPRARGAADETDRVLRQRGALLRQSGGRATGTWRPPSTCGTSAWPTPARSWWRPGSAWWATSSPWSAAAYSRLAGAAGAGAGAASATQRSWDGDLLDGPGAPAGATTCAAGSTRWARTATTWSWPSTGARPAPTPPRASSAAWPWPCASASTAWSAPGRRCVPDAAPRRRVLRARPGPEQGPGGGAAGRPGAPHHGGPAARGHRRGRVVVPRSSRPGEPAS